MRRQVDEIDHIYTRWTKGPQGYAYDEAFFSTPSATAATAAETEKQDLLQPARRPPCPSPSKS
eukprot:3159314-Pyramimonas_sp.AAC.1